MNNHFLYVIGALFLIQSVIIISKPKSKPDEISKKKGFHWTTMTLLICQWLMVITCLVDSIFYPKISDYWNVLGLALVLLSAIITGKAFNDLGESYSSNILVKKGQKLVSTGAYKLIRNPMDLAELLFMIGLPLFASSHASLSYLIFFVPIMVIKISFEESLLAKELKGYKEYMKKTKKLIPFIY